MNARWALVFALLVSAALVAAGFGSALSPAATERGVRDTALFPDFAPAGEAFGAVVARGTPGRAPPDADRGGVGTEQRVEIGQALVVGRARGRFEARANRGEVRRRAEAGARGFERRRARIERVIDAVPETLATAAVAAIARVELDGPAAGAAPGKPARGSGSAAVREPR